MKAPEGQTKEKTENLAENKLTPQKETHLDPPAPTRKAPTLASLRAIEDAKKALDNSRSEFTRGFKDGPIPYGAFEKFASDIAFQERRINYSGAPTPAKERFKKEVLENRQILFAKFTSDIRLRLAQNSESWKEALPACKAILAGTSLMINASGLPKDRQEAFLGKVEGAIVKTLVETLKESIPRSKGAITDSFKEQFKARIQQIQSLPISDAAKQNVLKLISDELLSRKGGYTETHSKFGLG